MIGSLSINKMLVGKQFLDKSSYLFSLWMMQQVQMVEVVY